MTSATSTDEMMGADGTIDLTVTGGTAGYTYDWDNDGTGDNDDTQDLTGLTAGFYTVIVYDNNGCSDTLSIDVGTQVGIADNDDRFISVYPNPSQGEFTVEMSDLPESPTISVRTIEGKLLLVETMTALKQTFVLNEAERGVYVMELKGEGYQKSIRLVVQ